MTDEELERCRIAVKTAVLSAVEKGLVFFDDGDDVMQDAMLGIIRRGNVTVRNIEGWAAKVAWHKVEDRRRQYAKEAEMKRELQGKSIDPDTIRPCAAIAACPDALYEWDEQIGRWMTDNVPIWPAMLAKLRNHLIKHYNLK